MKKISFSQCIKFGLVLFAVITSLSTSASDGYPEWQSQYSIGLNKIAPHTYVFPYESEDAVINRDHKSTQYFLSLNGKWKFNWVKNPDSRPQEFYKPSFSVHGWNEINVPGNWERQGYGTAIYVNDSYEFDSQLFNFRKNPPHVPYKENEVGSYRRNFTMPQSWDGRRVVVCFEGVISFYYLWVNGEKVGYNAGSKTPAEWDITKYVKPGENTIAIEVYRWSSASYLECQDFWRLSGIERDVYVYSTPKTYIQDYKVVSSLDKSTYTTGIFGLDVKVDGNDVSAVDYKLIDKDRSVVKSGTLKGDFSLAEQQLKGVKTWSAESPNLYTLCLDLKDKSGKSIEKTGCRVGFRTSEIKDRQLMINGRPIAIRGTNRHDHSQAGRTVPREMLRKDVELMKKNNINTVRNSHYPSTYDWYELCDEYGLYMIDEANVESHGMGYGKESLAKDTTWYAAHLDRTRRMYERSKNHSCIIVWSLGNEAGFGVNFERTYKWMKSTDSSRPVQYERAEEAEYTDIFCPMYSSVDFMKNYLAKDNITRPIILCEYLHAMGNSCGGLNDYIEVFENNKLAQGGCIWDWVDQGFKEIDKNGKWWWAYGGDFGPANIPSFGNFNCNGLVDADRNPHPHLMEVKKAYQYIKAKMVDEKNLTIEIKNWYDFTNTNAYTLNWNLTGDNGEVIAQGNKVVDCNPRETTQVTFGAVKMPKNVKEVFLNISWTPRESTEMIPAGYEIAYDQFEILVNKNFKVQPVKNNARVSIEVDKTTGAISSYTVDGKQLLASPITLSLFRPFTDNDSRQWKGGKSGWDSEGLAGVSQRATSIKHNGTKWNIDVDIINLYGTKIATASYQYTLKADKELEIITSFVPDTAVLKSIARLGLTFEMPYEFKNMKYLGRGETETYNDRKMCGKIGVYTTDAEANFHYYVKPQETGNHTDVRYAEMFNEANMGIHVSSDKLFQFGAIPYSDKVIEESLHINDLERTDIVTVHLDYDNMGVGTATCGPGTQEKYRVKIAPVTFTFTLNPIK